MNHRSDLIVREGSGLRARRAEHAANRREVSRQQAVARERRAEAREREQHPPENYRAWWSNTTINALAGPLIEPRLPHVDGMLAVSDKTFARLAAMVEPAVRRALVAVNLKHAGWFDTPDTTAERQVAEDAYQGEAIDQEHARLKKLHAAAWRRGDAETPEPPTRREVMKDMAR